MDQNQFLSKVFNFKFISLSIIEGCKSKNLEVGTKAETMEG